MAFSADKTQEIEDNLRNNRQKQLALQAAKGAIKSGVLTKTADGQIQDVHGNVVAAPRALNFLSTSEPPTQVSQPTAEDVGDIQSQREDSQPAKRRRTSVKSGTTKKTSPRVSNVLTHQPTLLSRGSSTASPSRAQGVSPCREDAVVSLSALDNDSLPTNTDIDEYSSEARVPTPVSNANEYLNHQGRRQCESTPTVNECFPERQTRQKSLLLPRYANFEGLRYVPNASLPIHGGEFHGQRTQPIVPSLTSNGDINEQSNHHNSPSLAIHEYFSGFRKASNASHPNPSGGLHGQRTQPCVSTIVGCGDFKEQTNHPDVSPLPANQAFTGRLTQTNASPEPISMGFDIPRNEQAFAIPTADHESIFASHNNGNPLLGLADDHSSFSDPSWFTMPGHLEPTHSANLCLARPISPAKPKHAKQ